MASNDKLLSISASLIKNYWSYQSEDYCGILMHKANILKEVEITPTARMSLGHYFEYLCTGATLRDGSVPEEPLTKTGKPTAEGKRMKAHAESFKELCRLEDISVDSTGKVLEYPFSEAGFKLKGILDILGVVKGEKAIVDIKSSGLIGNEWEAYGWNKGTFNMRKQLTIQVVFYKYLAWKVLGIEDIPFYFTVFSSTNDVDSLFWRVDIKDFEVAMNHFEDMVFEISDEIKVNMEMGFNAYPDVKRCKSCPLKDECSHAIQTPILDIVEIDGIFE